MHVTYTVYPLTASQNKSKNSTETLCIFLVYRFLACIIYGDGIIFANFKKSGHPLFGSNGAPLSVP